MAFAKRPTQPPPLDSKGFVKRLREVTAKVGLGPFAVFGDDQFPVYNRWLSGTEEFDGSGLRDVVNANAIALDAVKDDLDTHKAADNVRHANLAQRVAALEVQPPSAPFPGGS